MLVSRRMLVGPADVVLTGTTGMFCLAMPGVFMLVLVLVFMLDGVSDKDE